MERSCSRSSDTIGENTETNVMNTEKRSCFRRVMRTSATVVWGCIIGVSPCVADSEIKHSKIVIEKPTYDFGSVAEGTKVTYDFPVKNVGDADLIIQRVVPTCGCTASSASAEPIPPGGTGAVHVEFDTTGFSGQKEKMVRIYSNDILTTSTIVTLTGKINANTSLEPDRAFFGELVRGERKNPIQIRVKLKQGAGVISTARSSSPYISVKELSGNAQEKLLEIALDPAAPKGELRERVIVGINGTKENTINIPVFATIRGETRLTPSTLSFGVLEGTAPIMRQVRLDNLGKTELNVKGIDSSNPAVTANFHQITPGKKYVIDVSVDPTKVARDLRAALTINTDKVGEPPLNLNVYGVLPPKQS